MEGEAKDNIMKKTKTNKQKTTRREKERGIAFSFLEMDLTPPIVVLTDHGTMKGERGPKDDFYLFIFKVRFSYPFLPSPSSHV